MIGSFGNGLMRKEQWVRDLGNSAIDKAEIAIVWLINMTRGGW